MFISQVLRYDPTTKKTESHGNFRYEGDAQRDLVNLVLEYIIKLEGENHRDLANIKEISLDAVMRDTKMRPGLYFKEDSEKNIITIYEKVIIPGTFWGSDNLMVEKCHFYIYTFELSESILTQNKNIKCDINTYVSNDELVKKRVALKKDNISYLNEITSLLSLSSSDDFEGILCPSKLQYKKHMYKKPCK